MSIRNQVSLSLFFLQYCVVKYDNSMSSTSMILQSSRRAEERAKLHHKRSACVFNSRSNKCQIRCAIRQAAGARSNLLRAYCRLRGNK